MAVSSGAAAVVGGAGVAVANAARAGNETHSPIVAIAYIAGVFFLFIYVLYHEFKDKFLPWWKKRRMK